MKDVLLVGIGGALGALSRFALGLAVTRWLGTGFPWATLAINLLGCLVIGLAMGGPAGSLGLLSRDMRLLGVIGFVGAFTTFSTFGWETVALLQAGKPGLAILYVASSVLMGLGAVALGLSVARALA